MCVFCVRKTEMNRQTKTDCQSVSTCSGIRRSCGIWNSDMFSNLSRLKRWKQIPGLQRPALWTQNIFRFHFTRYILVINQKLHVLQDILLTKSFPKPPYPPAPGSDDKNTCLGSVFTLIRYIVICYFNLFTFYCICKSLHRLTLSLPQASLSKTIALIDKFSSISDYSINWNKSTFLPVNDFQNMSIFLLQSGNIRHLNKFLEYLQLKPISSPRFNVN